MEKNKKLTYKKMILALLLVAFFIVGIAGTYALLHNETTEVNNEFKVGQVNVAVDERDKEHEDYLNNEEYYTALKKKGDAEEKIVKIKNIGIDAYVRIVLEASIVSDKNSNEVLLESVDVDYTFARNTSWKVDKEGTYYLTKVIKAGETSEVLLEKVTTLKDIPSGYHLEVKVLTDAISARPHSNLQKAWNIENFENMKDVN